MFKFLTLILLAISCNYAHAGEPLIWGSPYPTVISPKGGLRLKNSDTNTVCNAAAAGAMRYNAGLFQGCNGTAWSLIGLAPDSNGRVMQYGADASTYYQFTNSGTGLGPSDGLLVGLNGSLQGEILNMEAQSLTLGTSGQSRLVIGALGGITFSINSNVPTLTACGVDASVEGSMTVGRVTLGTGYANSCVMTMPETCGYPWVCQVKGEPSPAALQGVGTESTFTVDMDSQLSDGQVFTYMCVCY